MLSIWEAFWYKEKEQRKKKKKNEKKSISSIIRHNFANRLDI